MATRVAVDTTGKSDSSLRTNLSSLRKLAWPTLEDSSTKKTSSRRPLSSRRRRTRLRNARPRRSTLLPIASSSPDAGDRVSLPGAPGEASGNRRKLKLRDGARGWKLVQPDTSVRDQQQKARHHRIALGTEQRPQGVQGDSPRERLRRAWRPELGRRDPG